MKILLNRDLFCDCQIGEGKGMATNYALQPSRNQNETTDEHR